MTTYAALTDGTTTVTFASPGTLGWYRIETGWTPKVAGLRQDQLGGRGPYDDVTEEIPVSIGGSNAAHLYANVQTLERLLIQARQWKRGEVKPAVLFKYSPEGATVSTAASPLQVAVFDTALNLSNGWAGIPQSGSAVWTSGATMRLGRGGLWGYSSTTGSTASSASSGTLYALSLGASAPYLSPTRLQVDVNSGRFNTHSYLLATDASAAVIMGNIAASTTAWTMVADSTAYGGSVSRYTPTGTTERASATVTLALSPSYTLIGVIASVRNNSTTTSFTARMQIVSDTGTVYTNQVVVAPPAAASMCEWVSFGLVSAPRSGSSITAAYSVIASSASGTLDVNRICVYSPYDVSVTDFYVGGIGQQGVFTATIDHNYLTAPAPSGWALGYFGENFQTTSASPAYVALLTGGQNLQTSAFSQTAVQFSGTRLLSYLTPV